MPRASYLGAGAFLFVLTAAIAATAAFKSAGATRLQFSVAGPAGLTISGSGGRVKLSEEDGTLIARTAVTKLTTGMSMRDKHMHRYLRSGEYPESKLTVKRADLSVPDPGKSVSGTVTGNLTLNGQTKPLSIRYKATNKEGKIGVSALSEIEITNWGIEKPCLGIVCTDTKVKLKVAFTVKD